MKVQISFILICVFSSNCVCKDSSIDEDKYIDSNESSESEDKNTKLELNKARKHSHENNIHISSSSDTSEDYNKKAVLQGQNQNPWIIIQNSTKINKNTGNYTGRMLSSIEETSDLWAETQRDNIYSAKMRSEPQSDNIFHDTIIDSFENSRKMPAVMAIHYVKVPSSVQNERGNIEQKDSTTLQEKIKNIISLKTVKGSNFSHNNQESIEQEDIFNLQKKIRFNSKNKSENDKIDKAYSKESGNAKTKPNEISGDINLNSRNAWTGKKEVKINFGKITRTRENSEIKNFNVLHSSSENRPSEMPRESYNENESIGTAIAAIDSTIEVSDHAYQANKDAKESEGDDHETLQDYPYTASVLRKGAHYASGALVGERWILSSAAEFYNVRESIRLFRARVGSVDCKKGGILTPLLSIAIHPKFIPGHHAFDISLLKTAEPLLLSSVVKPIGISRIVQVATAKLLTTYWPRIVMKHGVAPSTAKERVKYNSMRVSTQRLEPTEECAALLAAVNVTLDKNSQCLMPLRVHHSDCMPDVGAPVVAVDGLWGITSGWVSPECPTILLPTIFTRVSRLAIRAWINDHIQTQATT